MGLGDAGLRTAADETQGTARLGHAALIHDGAVDIVQSAKPSILEIRTTQ
jgi:hypothetical protein